MSPFSRALDRNNIKVMNFRYYIISDQHRYKNRPPPAETSPSKPRTIFTPSKQTYAVGASVGIKLGTVEASIKAEVALAGEPPVGEPPVGPKFGTVEALIKVGNAPAGKPPVNAPPVGKPPGGYTLAGKTPVGNAAGNSVGKTPLAMPAETTPEGTMPVGSVGKTSSCCQ